MITRHRYDLQGDLVYEGLSSDTKPIEDIPENAVFLELDTGNLYFFSNGAWVVMA